MADADSDPDPDPHQYPDPDPDPEVPYRSVRVICWEIYMYVYVDFFFLCLGSQLHPTIVSSGGVDLGHVVIAFFPHGQRADSMLLLSTQLPAVWQRNGLLPGGREQRHRQVGGLHVFSP